MDDKQILSTEPNGRDLYVFGEIDQPMINSIVLPILKFNKDDENLIKREPITIYIHSEGGSTWVALAIVDIILQSKTPVKTINLGYAASGAFLILAAGHHRVSYKNSSHMVHTVAWSLNGKAPEIRSNVVELDSLERRITQFLKEKTMIDESDLKRINSNEWWMESDEALEYMVIDEIIGG